MKKHGKELTIHCFFTEEGENPQEIILQSLRAFIEIYVQNRTVF